MDWLTFISSVVDSLAWPSAVVLSVFILRRALSKLLPELNAFKYKDLELKFGRELKEARRKLETSPRPALPPQETESVESSVDLIEQFTPYYTSVAASSPRAAILEAWIEFESTATASARKLDLLPQQQPFAMPKLIQVLQDAELLTNDEASALGILRHLRNAVVHEPKFELPPDLAGEFAGMAHAIGESIARRAKTRLPKE